MGRYALVLGTATYHSDRGIAPLPSVVHDVRQVKAVLDHAGGFDDVDARLDLNRGEMARAIDEFFGARRRGDLAFLYYSGHGLLLDRESLFLGATDTEREHLHATAIDTAALLKDLLSRTYATQKVVVLDCCYSGAFAAGNRFRGGVREEPRGGLRYAGTFILTSSTHVRASFARGDDRPSVFTEVLLDGLRGAADPRDGSSWITTHDLSHYVQAETARRGGLPPSESSEGVTEPIPLVATQPEQATAARSRSSTLDLIGTEAPLDADRWRRLLRYYIACIERSAALQSFVNLADRQRYETLPSGMEPVFAGGSTIRLEGSRAALAQRAVAAGGELRYGYPVVVQRASAGKRPVQFAPLLECDASVGPDGVLRTTLPPRVNAALAAERGLSGKEIDEVDEQIEETFVAGDPAAVAETVRRLTEVLAVPPAVPLDPAGLSDTLQPGPLRRVQNCAVLFTVDTANSAAGQLLEDLREIAANPGRIAQTALGALAEVGVLRPVPSSSSGIVAPDLLNEAQEQVIHSAMTNRLTVAQGPPGTGKTQLVSALVATATAAGRTVLVGSTNNRAVNEVSERCDALVGPGLLIRSGNKQYQSQEPKLLTELITAHSGGRPPDSRTPEGELRVLSGRIDEARTALDDRAVVERDLADLVTERVAQGPSDDLPADQHLLHRLIRRADHGLRHRVLGWWARRRLRTFGVVDRPGLEAFAHRVTIELRWLRARDAIAGMPDDRAVWRRLRGLTAEDRVRVSRGLVAAQVATRVRNGSAVLQRRCEEMSGPSPRSWSRFAELIKVLPAWAVTALSARRIPPTPALFDLVVIDEAAACTIPAVLPMLFRAKQALIIGDPRQLAPVVPLPREEDARYRVEAGLGAEWLDARRLVFTSHSAYDAFAVAVPAVRLLDEHYRCHPQIIATPNREVYQDRLIVLTAPADLTPQADPAVVWRHVDGRYSRASLGSGYNTLEVQAVVTEIAELRDRYPEARLGVVTPLAPHSIRLQKALADAGFSADDVACGTAHRFQGGQRDIIVISPVGAHGIVDSTRNWLVGETNLWNVAITRAKALLVVVGDRSWWSGQRGMLAGYAAGTVTESSADPQCQPAADALHGAALEAGLRVRRDATINGYRYDLVVQQPHGPLAILIDAPSPQPDGRRLRTALARLELAGAGVPVERVPVWRCLAEPAEVISALPTR